ncbi:MAG: hypothetical protein ACN6O6_04680 [Pseudomonas sp.]
MIAPYGARSKSGDGAEWGVIDMDDDKVVDQSLQSMGRQWLLE